MEHSHTILQKLLTMQMCAPLCKSVHQIVSEQGTQLSFTWAASIIPSFQWLWHDSNFWGRSSICTLILDPGDLVSSGNLSLLSMVFHTCRIHSKDEHYKKRIDSWPMLKNLGTCVSSLMCWGTLRGWSPQDGCRCWGWPRAGASPVLWTPPKLSLFAPLKMEPKVSS